MNRIRRQPPPRRATKLQEARLIEQALDAVRQGACDWRQWAAFLEGRHPEHFGSDALLAPADARFKSHPGAGNPASESEP